MSIHACKLLFPNSNTPHIADPLPPQLDYCPGGEIFSYLRRQRRFPEHVSRFYLAEIVLILEFLHEREGVAYRDLKPENILLDAAGHVKLVDFGFAKRVRDSTPSFPYRPILSSSKRVMRRLTRSTVDADTYYGGGLAQSALRWLYSRRVIANSC